MTNRKLIKTLRRSSFFSAGKGALLHEAADALEDMEWLPIETAPEGIPVLVPGGIAMQKTGGEWFTGMEEPMYQRRIKWDVTCWKHLPEPPEVEK